MTAYNSFSDNAPFSTIREPVPQKLAFMPSEMENTTLIYALLGICSVILAIAVSRVAYPRPYPGIPYNIKSASRITGDIPDLVPVISSTNEFSNSIFAITTQKLGSPIAQFLFPGMQKPLIILEDPREIEDIFLRRNKEFDKAPMTINIFQPMFPKGSLAQYTTPELRAQKRLWADVMTAGFLHRATAPRIHKAALELVELWRLKATTTCTNKPFTVLDDILNTTLDAIWSSVLGDEAGTIDYSIKKLQSELNGKPQDFNPPRGTFIREEVDYISNTISQVSNTPAPKLAAKVVTYTPRYRKFRRTITREISSLMKAAVEKFQELELESLDNSDADQCMMDQVLRRQVLQAKKGNNALVDPTKDQTMLDELFVLLVGGHDSTANALTWFIRFMEAYPSVQTQLRKALNNAFPGNKVPSAEEITHSDIPYLDAAIEEGFRLAGVAKASLRQALVDTSILGCPIPKGAEIIMNYHINRQPVPVDESKRSETCRANVVKTGDGLQGRAGFDLAFGGGYRGCVGRKLATLEFRILITLLVLNFEFVDLPEGMKNMAATEKVFRQPEKPFAKLKVL
ncbi:unnamed protein product [Clonostachys rosea f. rosea IK726]|uniref:Uncharacterized protein n=1 Tax=Clonostachys rosea f. rosea IK726 TaxID=1349383 RepID=A0ACA9U5F1_BIOOC|nr:unnamed protein product [Clonostachys rosea f. rosea IK726]